MKRVPPAAPSSWPKADCNRPISGFLKAQAPIVQRDQGRDHSRFQIASGRRPHRLGAE